MTRANNAVRAAGLLIVVLVAACDSDPDGPSAPAYSTVVQADAPIAYWRLEEAAGPVANDSSAFRRNGAFLATPTFGSTVGEHLGHGVGLTSLPDGVEIAFATWMNVAALTVEAWVRPTQVIYPDGILLVDKGESWGLTIQSDGRPAFALPHAPGFAKGTTVLQVGTLYHLVGTYQAGTLQLFVNGVLGATDTAGAASLRSTTETMHIGRGLSTPQFDYIGGIDEVAIYDRVLTPARIQAHYEAGR